jgi:hypothetical protein
MLALRPLRAKSRDASGVTEVKLAAAVLLACCASVAHAQVPHIVGTWTLNTVESKLPPGPLPQTHVRRYSLDDDGTLIGVAVVVDARGVPHFLQFAAKPDGRDYPELDERSAADYLKDGTKPPRTYAETPIDSHTVEWVDKAEGRVIARGRKWVTEDGKQLRFTAESLGSSGEKREFLYVFDRTGP